MEISKSLQDDIQSVQNKLKNAIQNHQVYVGMLNDDPNNEELLGQIHEIQEHIISLSKCQKQVVQRLRKEVKLYEAANSNGTKVSIASLLGLNNNNNMTNNNETKISQSKRTVNGKNLNGLSRRSSKDDYEDGIRNVDIPSPANDCQNNCAKARPRLNETDSNDEEDVIEIAINDNSITKRGNDRICEIQLFNQLDFLGSLGLITSDKHTELQNKRAERKRRSTANPQFVYSNWEIPTKRKRHSYLQSNGTAPQTRQATARLNGPSPPPNKVVGKPSTPLTRAPTKSLIPTQKSSTRPNILRNNPENKVFAGKIKSENGLSQGQNALSVKSVQSVGSKAVHIPGLPSSLTIERIENDASAVCIHCRNPGSLTVCEICAANFHGSCHVVASAPPRTCPKCVTKSRERENSDALAVVCKEEDEIATTSNTSGIVGETGEDSEVHKTSRGFHKVDAAEKRSVSSTIDVNQLPSSTFLIPIASNSAASSSSSSSSKIGISQSENISLSSVPISRESNLSMSYPSILINQLSKPPTFKSDIQASYPYQLPVSSVQQEKSQSYLILKKVSESTASSGRSKLSASIVVGNQHEKRSSSSIFDYQQSSTAGYNDHDQSEIKSISAAGINEYLQPNCRQFSGKFTFNGQAFHRAENTPSKSISSGESEFRTKSFNGDKCIGKLHSRLSINQLRPSRDSNTFLPLHSIINDVETLSHYDVSKQSENPGKTGQFLSGVAAGKGKSKNLLHSLFPSNNQPHPFPGCVIHPKNSSPEQIQPEFDFRSSQDRQSKLDSHDRPRPRLQSSSSSDIAEHVKLEEAHLPAPLRSNLIRKSVEHIDAILEKKQDYESSRDQKCDDLLDRRSRNYIKSKIDGSQASSVQDDNISNFTSFEDYHNEHLRATLDFIAIERNHSSTYIKFHDFEDREDAHNRCLKKVYAPKQKTSLSGSTNELWQKSFPPLRNKQLLPHEIKAEFERQDLPINEDELTKNTETITLDTSTDSLSEESKAKMGINAVSTENMQVLEQFESAMLEADEDETANC